ncbi:MAG: hypothetical protein AAF533_10355 [Acidobacteriota bacterium]
MITPEYDANLYPRDGSNPTISNADPSRADVGVCFSGGGSRALTCAWGQMIGLRNLTIGDESLLDRIRYLSSVSGGTWASALWVYLPESVPEDEFFSPLVNPGDLAIGTPPSGGMDVSEMGPLAMGRVPQDFESLFEPDPLKNIIAEFLLIVGLQGRKLSESLPWLWMYIVGLNVLRPFSLYDYSIESVLKGEPPWSYEGAKSFTLSKSYAAAHVLDLPLPPLADGFVYVHGGAEGSPNRPIHVINTNIVGPTPSGAMGPILVPIQVSPVSGGSLGSDPTRPEPPLGGGSVESFAFTSQLQSTTTESPVTSAFPRTHGLVDITCSSSAFFAAALAERVPTAARMLSELDEDSLRAKLGEEAEQLLCTESKTKLASLLEEAAKVEPSDLVPRYDYWPVARADEGPAANTSTQFADGGNLDNTGVLGMLAQTDVATIVSFMNTDVPLEQTSDGVIVAAAQAAPLFGVAWDSVSKQFQAYEPDGVNPFTEQVDPKGFIQVFDNSADEFAALREGLHAANGSGDQSGPAFFRQSLTVLANATAGVEARDTPLTVLWVQNAVVRAWQSQVTNEALSNAITTGQRSGHGEFASFPYYSTFTKVHASAAETNTLAQMWAWCVGSPDSPLSSELLSLF